MGAEMLGLAFSLTGDTADWARPQRVAICDTCSEIELLALTPDCSFLMVASSSEKELLLIEPSGSRERIKADGAVAVSTVDVRDVETGSCSAAFITSSAAGGKVR